MFCKVMCGGWGWKGTEAGREKRGKCLGNISTEITYYFGFTARLKAKYQLNFFEEKNRCINPHFIPLWPVCPLLFARLCVGVNARVCA